MADIVGVSLKTLVAACKLLPVDISVMIQGETGIGKSEIVRQLADHWKLPVIDRRVSQMCEGDLLGVPSIMVDGKLVPVKGQSASGVTVFNPPAWFKECCDEARVLFLDETNRGDAQVLQGVFQIILDRCLGPYKLHPDTRVYGAVNVGAIYQVTEMDPAFINRFALFRFEPTVEEWLAYAKQHLDPLVHDFIKLENKFLERQKGEPYDPGQVYPTRRSWSRYAKAAKEANVLDDPKADGHRAMARAMIGDSSTSKFFDFVANQTKVVTVEELLADFKKVAKRIENLGPEKYSLMIDKVQDYSKDHKFTEEQCKNLARFFRAIPDELVVSGWTKLAESGNLDNIKETHKYVVAYVMEALGRDYSKTNWKGPDGEDANEYLKKHPRIKMPATAPAAPADTKASAAE